jgi:hypothetical protein
MPDDRVLFRVGGLAPTLSVTCLVLGLASLVVAGLLFALLAVRHGQRRKLGGEEASRVAFNADKLGEVRSIHGPARGVEVRMSFTIGDLRKARQTGDNLVFWGVPAMMTAWSWGFGLLCLWGALLTRETAILIAYVVLIPIFLLGCFMPWAAVHTKLE